MEGVGMWIQSITANNGRFPESQKMKKFRVVVRDATKTKTIYFGDRAYEDYTQHKDTERRYNYLMRHKARENWSDPWTPGFWSRWLLWETSDYETNLAKIKTAISLIK